MTDVNYEEIWTLIQLRRYSLAKSKIAEAFAADPAAAELFYAAAHIAWLESDTEEGLEISGNGLAQDPHHVGLLYVRFLLLEEAEQYAEAETIIISLIGQYPQDADYISAYARLMLLNFHIEKSRKLCNEALRLDPQNTNAKVVDLLLNVVNGKLKNAEVTIQGLLQENPDSARYIRLLILLLVNKKRNKSALVLTQELIRKDPQDQDLINLAIELRKTTHWSSLPLWPLYRFGWPASIAIWIGAILIIQLNKNFHFPGLTFFSFFYLGWVVYSWVHAPILGKWLKYRGI